MPAYNVVPAGRGMAMIQSDPMPVADAQAKVDELNGPEENRPGEGEAEMPMAGGMMGKPPMGGGVMPRFGPRGPAAAPAVPPRPGRGMPPFGGGGAPGGMMGG